MNAQEIFGGAKWLTPGDTTKVVYIRGEFSLKAEVASAELTVCGLGFYEFTINGKPIDDDLYGTLSTDFNAYDSQHCKVQFGEETSHRIYVKKVDVSGLLSENNCIGVTLAPGWYHNVPIADYGPMTLCYRLDVTYTDGSCTEFVSDDSLRFAYGNIVDYQFYYGERQDWVNIKLDGWQKFGYDMSDWKPLTEIDAPESEYMYTDCPPDRIIRYITPVLMRETDDAFIYDMGENITGTPIIVSRTPGVNEIKLSVSERLNPDGTIEDYTNHGQNSTFITDSPDRKLSLRFMWYGFRYASVSKNAKIVSCAVIHTDVEVSSSFRSDNKLLDWIYTTYVRTQLDNMHCGIPSDCPHLEKRGYTGDGQLVGECAMLMLDAQKFYKKWLGDISDCQDKVSGHVQYTAPYIHSGGGPGGWGCAIAEVPYAYYKLYGDKSVLEEFLPKTLRYFDYLEAHSENDLVTSDQKGLWCLGDWCTPEDMIIPDPFVNNYFYIKTINRLIEFCNILGKPEFIPNLEALAERKKAAVIREYYNDETGDFAENVQGANAFAVDLGLGDERTFKHIVEHYRRETWYDTGIFGTDIVTRVLFERGEEQLAFDLLTSKGKYSFHHWMSTGCTTFPEYWTYKRSQNHPMFGGVVKYLFYNLLGIKQVGAGFDKLTISPAMVDGLGYADGHITTRHGEVRVKYVKQDGFTSFEVTIPDGVDADFAVGEYKQPLCAGINRIVV